MGLSVVVTTLIRLINRLIEPTSGSIYIGEDDISNMSKKNYVKFVVQKLIWCFKTLVFFRKELY